MHRQSFPVSFDSCQGQFNGTNGPVGIVMCPPWGFDELCSKKFFRNIGDALAAEGLPALRFDYPNTADSADKPDCNIETWISSAQTAANELKRLSGCRSLILLGMGVGAIVADKAAAGRDDVSGLIFAAPVANGRHYLRELKIRALVTNEGLSLLPNQIPDGVSIAGMKMPEAVASDLKSINLYKEKQGGPKRLLVLRRSNVASDADLGEHFASLGYETKSLEFSGYEKLMDNPTVSVVPETVVQAIVSWCSAARPSEAAASPPAQQPQILSEVSAAGYRETGVSMNPESPLYGVLCEPAVACPGPILILLNSGYDHRSGWARIWVKLARELASVGIPSLRFDFSNVGDSPPRENAPAEVLYTEFPIQDTQAALDFLTGKFDRPILLVGRCSGAYTALHCAFRDARTSGAVLINQLRLIWDPEEDLQTTYTSGPRPVGEYKKRAANLRTFKRLFTGQVDVIGVMRSLCKHADRRLNQRILPRLGIPSKYTRFRKQCHQMFEAFRERGTSLYLICSVGDESLEQLAIYFGDDLRGLKKYSNVSLEKIPDADHNLTPDAAQQRLIELILKIVSPDKT